MAVIKSANTSRLVRNAVVLDLSDLGRQAEVIRAEARAEAEAILAEARVEAERLRAEAAEAGRGEGHAEGLEAGREAGRHEGRDAVRAELAPRMEAVAQAWTAAVDGWEEQRGEMLALARADLIDLALALARRVVHRVIEQDPAVIADQLDEALALVGRGRDVQVRIDPSDRALVEEVLPALVDRLGNAAHVALRDDDTVGAGGCVITTAGGQVDARIETMLDRLAEALQPRGGEEPA